jgi:hypothetical protein
MSQHEIFCAVSTKRSASAGTERAAWHWQTENQQPCLQRQRRGKMRAMPFPEYSNAYAQSIEHKVFTQALGRAIRAQCEVDQTLPERLRQLMTQLAQCSDQHVRAQTSR